MTTADADRAGLDPAHVLAICTKATGSASVQAVSTPDRVRVSLPTRTAGRDASTALGRVGYTAAFAGHASNSRYLVITGWDTARLDSRLSALRTVMHRLADSSLVTAAAAVRRFADLP